MRFSTRLNATSEIRAAALDDLEPFAVDVQRRNGLAVVQPRGELDIATVETLRAELDGIVDAGRLVIDLRGLSFIDSTGLQLLVVVNQRARRDGFELALLAPASPTDKPIRLCRLDETLPFVSEAEAALGEPASGSQVES